MSKDKKTGKVPVVRRNRIEMRYAEELGLLSPRRPDTSDDAEGHWDQWSFDEDDPDSFDLGSSMLSPRLLSVSASTLHCYQCGFSLGISGVRCANCGAQNSSNDSANGSDISVSSPLISNDELELIRPPIGQGAFSVVFKGKCRGKDVAVKVLKIEINSLSNLNMTKNGTVSTMDSKAVSTLGLQSDKRVHRILASEVGVLSRLTHPNIIAFLGTCFDLDVGKYLNVISEDEELNDVSASGGLNGVCAAIVMEYMPRGDLRSVLSLKIPVYQRLQFAIDIAEAMAWLTGPQLQTLHRDLKPQNVLVDENWNCKVADFGLSQLTKLREQIRDRGRSPGTALYSAPEVLSHQPVDKKLDVYSFALVLWECITCKQPFANHSDYDEFVHSVVVKGERPPLDGIPDLLGSIIARCWDADPKIRPDFNEIIGLLVQARLELYLPFEVCPYANNFWTSFAHNSCKVSLYRFVSTMCDALKVDKEKRELFPKCLLELILDKDDLRSQTISIECFSNLLKWFGPLRPHGKFPHIHNNLVDRIVLTMSQPWFFGPIGSPKAATYLQNYATPGTFLVRLNPGGNEPIEKAPITISRVNGDRTITHVRIRPYKTKGYALRYEAKNKKVEKIKQSLPLDILIEYLIQNHRDLCGQVCGAYPYKRIFASPLGASNGYNAYAQGDSSDSSDDDDDDNGSPLKGSSPQKRYH